MIDQIANELIQNGLQKGDKIALSCPNLPFFPMVYYAILKIGAMVVPINVLLKHREIAYHLRDSDAKAYFCFIGTDQLPMGKEGSAGFNEVEQCKNFWMITPQGVISPIEAAASMSNLMKDQSLVFHSVDTEANDTAVILYTSGTTGQAKGAELSHSNIYFNTLL